MTLPSWFQTEVSRAYDAAPDLANKKVRLLFLDRTLKAMARIFEEFILSETYTRKPGILQKLDARVKLVSILLLVVTLSFLRSIPLIFFVYGLTLGLAWRSGIEAVFFLKRVWFFIAFFIGILAFPITLNLFTPGDPIGIIFSLGKEYRWGPYEIPSEITLTRQGIFLALLLVGRVAASMSLVLLLTLTTPWADLLKALRLVRVPTIYVQTLGMAFRYLMLLSQVVREMHIAKKSRTVFPGRAGAEQRWIAGQVGTLFKRSMHLSVEVHQAMTARGYQGESRILNVFHIHRQDYLWMFFCAALSILLICFGR